MMRDLSKYLADDLIRLGNFTLSGYQVIFILLTYLVTKLLLSILKRSMLRYYLRRHPGLSSGSIMAVFQLFNYFAWIVAIIVMLQTANVRLSLFLAGSAALLVGVGLGLQQIFQDIISGVFILIERNIKVGDVMDVDNKFVGRITTIGLRTSNIITRDGTSVIVPNHKFITDSVINWSSAEKLMRFRIGIGVAYGSDVGLVSRLLAQAANDHPDVSKAEDSRVNVRLVDFGEHALRFELLFWTSKKLMVEDVKSEVRYNILQKLTEAEIKIPFPQRDVRVQIEAMDF